ncbi:hypothetical protein RIF29_04053 [Crotalaria pallida]|uniref:Uncharacterized protein n=1 Tax=Crotalaria pallida TaxID=3830 RepID=A0AAN9J0M2_CROPI
MPSSASSTPPALTSTLSMKSKSDGEGLELSSPSKDSNLTYKNQHQQQRRSMSLSRSHGRRTHAATPDEFDLMKVSSEEHDHDHDHENMHHGSFFKAEAIIKDGTPKGSGKGKKDALCMCLPCFGKKAKKQVKARKEKTKIMDHHHHHYPVDSMIMSSTFSFENFERISGMASEKNEDESISSYFELPISQTFKSSCDGAQALAIPAFLLDKDIKGDHL